MKTVSLINHIIALLFAACYFYQFLYIFVPFVKKSRAAEAGKLHRYAVLIAARNEEAVIAKLIESIKNQNYPSELIEIFVVADNCTDNTAQKARTAGAYVYERFNRYKIGKGYAIEFLLDRIAEEYPESPFDGYFVFDADNLLDENYIAEMNKSFSNGNRIITSYRNSKNYGSNWISAGTALWFLRESQYLSRSRSLLGVSCAVSGTGFLFHREIIERSGGWKFFLLTEDIEFSIYNVINGERIAYCESAVLYDEQPARFRQSWNQRMRWTKGNMQVCRKYGARLIKSIFKNKSFSSFDMTMTIFPAVILAALSGIINLTGLIYGFTLKSDYMTIIQSLWESMLKAYFMFFMIGMVTTITEWKRIYCPAVKKILYAFTFPIFMFTYVPITIAALFKKVEWKPIEHRESITLKEIRKAGSHI
ncbi:MAG: glycosyltransferase family 2 protein [Caldicoprobacterales bacterium]|jgi:cellulose synthase/poly-beta-1,6-N-acetylglucosamine synthase-like glycosyltransferase|nr:glycosyltransferase family 2 protein [Clostridiales bacterium]